MPTETDRTHSAGRPTTRCDSKRQELARDVPAGQFVKEVMGGVSVVNAETGAPVAATEASFPPGAVIAMKIEKEESGARLKMR